MVLTAVGEVVSFCCVAWLCFFGGGGWNSSEVWYTVCSKYHHQLGSVAFPPCGSPHPHHTPHTPTQHASHDSPYTHTHALSLFPLSPHFLSLSLSLPLSHCSSHTCRSSQAVVLLWMTRQQRSWQKWLTKGSSFSPAGPQLSWSWYGRHTYMYKCVYAVLQLHCGPSRFWYFVAYFMLFGWTVLCTRQLLCCTYSHSLVCV